MCPLLYAFPSLLCPSLHVSPILCSPLNVSGLGLGFRARASLRLGFRIWTHSDGDKLVQNPLEDTYRRGQMETGTQKGNDT